MLSIIVEKAKLKALPAMVTDINKLLASSPLFSGLAAGDIGLLADTAMLIKLKKREVLFNEGDPVDGFYCVASGAVKIFKVSNDGKEHVLHLALPGQTFAEAALFIETGFPAFAEASEKSSVVKIRKDTFMSVLRSDEKVCLKLFNDLSIWIRRLTDIITSLSFRDVERRLAAYLYKECEAIHGSCESGMAFQLGVEKSLLASYLGTIPETLSRTIKKLRETGLFQIEGSSVTIADADALRDFIDVE